MSGCSHVVDLEGYVVGELPDARATEVALHVAACASCAAEVRALRAERRMFRAREAWDETEVPSFAGVLARMKRAGDPVPIRSQRLWMSVGMSAAAAVVGLFVASRWLTPVEPPKPATSVAAEEPLPDESCFEGQAAQVEENAYASDRAIATVEEDWGACMMATPRRECSPQYTDPNMMTCVATDQTVTCANQRP